MAEKYPGRLHGESVPDWAKRRTAELGQQFVDAPEPLAEDFLHGHLCDAVDALGGNLANSYFLRLIASVLDGRRKRFNDLMERVAALEAREQRSVSGGVMRYAGVYTAGAAYEPGEIVTHSGTVWYCHEATTNRPGASEAWQMMAKTR